MEPRQPLRLTVGPPTAETIAALVEKVTGRPADVEKIRARLTAKLAARARPACDTPPH
jgi:hypothetical protein